MAEICSAHRVELVQWLVKMHAQLNVVVNVKQLLDYDRVSHLVSLLK